MKGRTLKVILITYSIIITIIYFMSASRSYKEINSLNDHKHELIGEISDLRKSLANKSIEYDVLIINIDSIRMALKECEKSK